MNETAFESLRALARSYGLQPAYCDATGRRRTSSPAALIATLQLLGVPIESPQDATALLHTRQLEQWRRCAPPALVVWEGAPFDVDLRLPAAARRVEYRCETQAETVYEGSVDRDALVWRGRRNIGSEQFHLFRLRLSNSAPFGYHRLTLRIGYREWTTLVISAPLQAFSAATSGWGVFLPLYALHQERSWGGGDFSDLAALIDWADERGAKLVATLPLSASFAEQTGDPSPYAPASRLFGNELYLDPTQCEEFQLCDHAKASWKQAHQAGVLAGLRATRLVDYAGWSRCHRQIVSLLAEAFFTTAGDRRREQFARFLADRPDAPDYARFRAAGERFGLDWQTWPERGGTIPPETIDQTVYQYHLYAQWQLHEQLAGLVERAAARQMTWYVDLPLGVRADGYDAWRERALFVRSASGGAPPDVFFTKGQNWTFPPLNPMQLREQHYRYFIDTLRVQMRYARLLRLDHVMGLHRLYWIPRDFEATNGVYVRYPADELLAILALESHRHGCGIVGENLGTVSPIVNQALKRHGVRRMFVLQYEVSPVAKPVVREPDPDEVASLNTHDMPPFAAFWQGGDIADRFDLGLMTPGLAEEESAARAVLRLRLVEMLVARGFLKEPTTDVTEILRALLAFLGASKAPMVVVNLEDLWLETLPQNTPGTLHERPNWRRRARLSLEQLRADPQVAELLQTLAASRPIACTGSVS